MTSWARLVVLLLCSLPLVAVAEAMERSLRPMPRPAAPDGSGPPLPALVEAPAPPMPPEPPVLYSGQDVFAVAEFRCGLQADFLRGYWADVVEVGDQPVLRLRDHIAVMANHGLTDNAGNPDTTSSLWGDYWCIPQKAWCYGEVAETAFGAKLTRGSVLPWPATDVLRLEAGFVPAFAQTMAQRCAVAPAPVPAAPADQFPFPPPPSIGPQ